MVRILIDDPILLATRMRLRLAIQVLSASWSPFFARGNNSACLRSVWEEVLPPAGRPWLQK